MSELAAVGGLLGLSMGCLVAFLVQRRVNKTNRLAKEAAERVRGNHRAFYMQSQAERKALERDIEMEHLENMRRREQMYKEKRESVHGPVVKDRPVRRRQKSYTEPLTSPTEGRERGTQ